MLNKRQKEKMVSKAILKEAITASSFGRIFHKETIEVYPLLLADKDRYYYSYGSYNEFLKEKGNFTELITFKNIINYLKVARILGVEDEMKEMMINSINMKMIPANLNVDVAMSNILYKIFEDDKKAQLVRDEFSDILENTVFELQRLKQGNNVYKMHDIGFLLPFMFYVDEIKLNNMDPKERTQKILNTQILMSLLERDKYRPYSDSDDFRCLPIRPDDGRFMIGIPIRETMKELKELR